MDDEQQRQLFIDKAVTYHNTRAGIDPLEATAKQLGYRPYVPPGGVASPRADSRGMDLLTGEVDPAHGLAFANPNMNSYRYREAMLLK